MSAKDVRSFKVPKASTVIVAGGTNEIDKTGKQTLTDLIPPQPSATPNPAVVIEPKQDPYLAGIQAKTQEKIDAETVAVASLSGPVMPEREQIGGNKPPVFDTEGYREELGRLHKETVDVIASIAKRATDAPKEITTPEQAATVAQIIRDARLAGKTAIAKREGEERIPKLIMSVTLPFFKTNMLDRMDRIVVALTDRVTAYTRAVEEKARLEAEEIARKNREAAAKLTAKAEQAKTPETQAKHAVAAATANAQAQVAEAHAAAPAKDVVRSAVSSFGGQGKRVLFVEIDDYDKVPLELIRPYLDQDAILKALKKYATQTKGEKPVEGARIWWDTKAVVK